MMTARSGSRARARASRSIPERPLMLKSVTTTWKLPVSRWRSASSPLVAVSTSYPSLASSPFSATIIARSSSTTSTRPCMVPSALRGEGQRDDELGPAPGLADDVDRALVRLDDLPRDRHAEAGPPGLGGEERIEDAVDPLGRDAAAVVAYAHGGLPCPVFEEDFQTAAFRHTVERVDRVVEDVREHLAELLAVGEHGRPGDVVPRDGHLGGVE